MEVITIFTIGVILLLGGGALANWLKGRREHANLVRQIDSVMAELDRMDNCDHRTLVLDPRRPDWRCEECWMPVNPYTEEEKAP